MKPYPRGQQIVRGFADPIKVLGEFTVDVKLHSDVIAKVKVNVVAG